MFCSFTQSRFIIFPVVAVAVHFDIEMQAGNGVGAVFAHGGGLRHAEDHFESDIADDSALVQMMKPLPIGSRVALKADCAGNYNLDASKTLEGTSQGDASALEVHSIYGSATDAKDYVLVNFDQWASRRRYVVNRLHLDPAANPGPSPNSDPNTGMAPTVPPPTGGQAQLTPDAPNTDSPSRVELKAYLQKTLTELQRAIAEQM
jgi:hypothetical protein